MKFSFQYSIKSQTIIYYVLDHSYSFLSLVIILQGIVFNPPTYVICYLRHVYLQVQPSWFPVLFCCILWGLLPYLVLFHPTLLSFISSRIFLHLYGVVLVCMSAWLAEYVTPSISKVWKCRVKARVNMMVFLVAQFGCTYHLVVCDNWMNVRVVPLWWMSEIQRNDRVLDCKRTIYRPKCSMNIFRAISLPPLHLCAVFQYNACLYLISYAEIMTSTSLHVFSVESKCAMSFWFYELCCGLYRIERYWRPPLPTIAPLSIVKNQED